MSKAGDLYGQSLYDLAAEENLSEKILGEMEQVRGIFRENPDYIALLSEPSVPKNERLSLVDQAFNGSLSAYHLNFIKILIEKGLLREYSACYKRFRKSYNEAHGIAEALVTSAVSLSDAQLSQLKEKLEKISGKKILLKQKTDPDILGGVRVDLEGQLFDGTVKGRLSELRRKVDDVVI
ncbi:MULTISPECIES: ATP synthase F1 subunit delta [unclassified Butyrivibrio]|uniref:ATP synthase F1 subunit delta n=1 Tax=unclassified Butyrivibrio TaxID=2639466 RepID=UPI0003B58C67|nr:MULTISPECIES: ATP synthase F1 subunit delta [unclassified Butyrivibrio]MDC7292493.1 ATP synthase F1 subunit delta [Butyrivibrio sp. DSM 10294]